MTLIAQGATEFQDRSDDLRTHAVNSRGGNFVDRFVEMGWQPVENRRKRLFGLLRLGCPFWILAGFVDHVFKCGNVTRIVDAFASGFPLNG